MINAVMAKTNKRWIRRNRHVNSDLAINTIYLKTKAYISFLRKCNREYMFLGLLEKDMKDYSKLQTLDENLIEAVKKLFKDDDIDIDTEIVDENSY